MPLYDDEDDYDVSTMERRKQRPAESFDSFLFGCDDFSEFQRSSVAHSEDEHMDEDEHDEQEQDEQQEQEQQLEKEDNHHAIVAVANAIDTDVVVVASNANNTNDDNNDDNDENGGLEMVDVKEEEDQHNFHDE